MRFEEACCAESWRPSKPEYNLKKESEKTALFHMNFSAVSEARRKTHCRVDESVKRSRSTMMEPQYGTSAPLIFIIKLTLNTVKDELWAQLWSVILD